MRYRYAAVLLIVVAPSASCTSDKKSADSGSSASPVSNDPSRSGESPTTIDNPVSTLTDSKVVSASGTDTDICRAAIAATYPSGYEGSVSVIAKATFAPVRWLICQPEPDLGPGIVSARSEDETHWTVIGLCALSPKHAGDHVDAQIVDQRRAWITDDVPVAPSHTHGWTEDGGKTWSCFTA